MGNKIECYVNLDNLNHLEELRNRNKEVGYSKVIDTILTRHFSGDDVKEDAIKGLNKVIQGLSEKIQELEYEIRQQRTGKKKRKPKKDLIQPDDMNVGE